MHSFQVEATICSTVVIYSLIFYSKKNNAHVKGCKIKQNKFKV